MVFNFYYTSAYIESRVSFGDVKYWILANVKSIGTKEEVWMRAVFGPIVTKPMSGIEICSDEITYRNINFCRKEVSLEVLFPEN